VDNSSRCANRADVSLRSFASWMRSCRVSWRRRSRVVGDADRVARVVGGHGATDLVSRVTQACRCDSMFVSRGTCSCREEHVRVARNMFVSRRRHRDTASKSSLWSRRRRRTARRGPGAPSGQTQRAATDSPNSQAGLAVGRSWPPMTGLPTQQRIGPNALVIVAERSVRPDCWVAVGRPRSQICRVGYPTKALCRQETGARQAGVSAPGIVTAPAV